MPTDSDPQRRHQYGDDDRRGHPLQHRDREGWADRGTWTHLHDDPRGATDAGAGENEPRGRGTVDDAGRGGDDADHRMQAPDRSEAAQSLGSTPRRDDQRRATPERAHGGRRNAPTYKSQGNPRTGSHRGTDSEHGIGGETGGQFGELHGPRPSGAALEGYHEDHRVGGRRGRSARDAAFGSRRGTGLGRRRDPRVDAGE